MKLARLSLAVFSGWRRNAALFALGVCATLTLPPFYLFPLLVPAYGGLYLFLHHAPSRRRAFIDGFFWGWGFFISGLYWFVIALLTDPEKFAWLIPPALFGLTAIIALYSAVFAWLYYGIRRNGLVGAALFALLWTAIEYGRGHLFSGFPWNLAGYVFGIAEAPLQLASVIGIYGLTWLAVWSGVMCVLGKRKTLMIIVITLCYTAWGYERVNSAATSYVPDVTLRLVQANIAQHHKWDPALQMEGVRKHIALTHSDGMEKITHIIWPETAIPFALHENSTLVKRFGEVLLPGQYLISGTLRKEIKGNNYDLYNSIVMIDSSGAMVGQYDKRKLVPFGEFLPLRALIPQWLKTPVGERDFARGHDNNSMIFRSLPPVGALICYEVIFPHLAFYSEPKPAWLLSVTNDAWFGHSTAPYQHLAMARMRAVEQGVPMVRVANTGITAVFDGYGREVGRINLGISGVLDVRLPEPIQKNTIYRRIFD